MGPPCLATRLTRAIPAELTLLLCHVRFGGGGRLASPIAAPKTTAAGIQSPHQARSPDLLSANTYLHHGDDCVLGGATSLVSDARAQSYPGRANNPHCDIQSRSRRDKGWWVVAESPGTRQAKVKWVELADSGRVIEPVLASKCASVIGSTVQANK